MLSTAKLTAFIPTRDADLARAFYESILGLDFLQDNGFALIMDSNGTAVRITRVPEFTPFPFTLVGWETPDIEARVAELEERGVQFLHFSQVNQDRSGIWTAPSGARVAWFKDPDGNILSVSQH
jgi:catechol 2,3-dioxygenase-like lactoylglutathione lyase family enzyme